MEKSDLTLTQVVDQPASQVFKAITNVRGWWSEEIEGGTENLNDVFNYHYEICSNAWSQYFLHSLKSLITTGKGKPNGKGKPQTENEKRLSGN